jgi:hypothetical protein
VNITVKITGSTADMVPSQESGMREECKLIKLKKNFYFHFCMFVTINLGWKKVRVSTVENKELRRCSVVFGKSRLFDNHFVHLEDLCRMLNAEFKK